LANPQIPSRLLQLDEITREDHYYITDTDVCFHLWEYVKGGSVTEHPSNQLIRNLQIPMDEQGNFYRWRWKGRAIEFAATALSQVVPSDFFQHFTWIPIPPSGAKGTASHDPRLTKVLRSVRPVIPDVRELVCQNVNHTSKEKGVSPEVRAVDFAIDESLAYPPPIRAILFDDVLTTGAHFKAMQMVLEKRFPGIYTMGLFLARTIRPGDPSVFGGDLQALLAQWVKEKT
jgi:hypothetical protein